MKGIRIQIKHIWFADSLKFKRTANAENPFKNSVAENDECDKGVKYVENKSPLCLFCHCSHKFGSFRRLSYCNLCAALGLFIFRTYNPLYENCTTLIKLNISANINSDLNKITTCQ